MSEAREISEMLREDGSALSLMALSYIESLRETNRHYFRMLTCDGCGKPIWECRGAYVVGCTQNSNTED